MKVWAQSLALLGLTIPNLLGLACKANESPQAGRSSALPTASLTAAPQKVIAKRKPHPLAGRWSATFEASKQAVRLPKDAPTKTWARDTGKKASGPVHLTLEISTQGIVTGKGRGALGALTIHGQMTDDALNATVTPAKHDEPLGMHGLLTGERDGQALAFRLRASGHDASLVRGGKGILKPLATP